MAKRKKPQGNSLFRPEDDKSREHHPSNENGESTPRRPSDQGVKGP